MKFHIKHAALIAMFVLCAVSIAMAEADYERLKPFADKIEAKMPNTWRVVEKKAGVIPEWHYEGLKYDGPRGLYLLLVGDHDVNYEWKDNNNIWHKEPILKEAIALWIMPPEYHQSWKRFFIFKGHAPTERIHSGEKVKIYGNEVTYRASGLPDRFKEVLPYASEFAGTPDHTVRSWTAWKKDISEVLHGAE